NVFPIRVGQRQPPLRLGARRLFSGVVEREQRLSRIYLRSPPHGEGFQRSSQGRGHIDEFAFDVTLHPVRAPASTTAAEAERRQGEVQNLTGRKFQPVRGCPRQRESPAALVKPFRIHNRVITGGRCHPVLPTGTNRSAVRPAT